MAGRPRNPAADAAIMTAALALLRERGYAGLTLDDVAHRAGVGKSSLYRRFRDRADLATAAIASMQRDLPPPTGDLRTDLIAYLRAVQADLGQVGLGVIASLLGHDRETLALHRARVIEPRARHSRQLLRDAQQRGEIRPGADLDAAMELLIGSLFTHALTAERSPHPWPQRAVDTILTGLRPVR
ncbi:MAG TPA: TetR/AcrR family transcriptional regulator [Streptosporangiaceae bacterium]